MKINQNVRGDISGGLMATLLALPESLTYGVIAFAPLGPDYLSAGIFAGLVALIFINIGSLSVNGAKILASGPYSLSSLMMASVLAFLLSTAVDGKPIDSPSALVLLLLVLFMAGVFQALFGLFRLGNLTKYIPYPVVSGLLNGTAILIVAGQAGALLGLPSGQKTSAVFTDPSMIQSATLAVGLVTVVSIIIGGKKIKLIPAPFIGIISGTAVYNIITSSGCTAISPVIGGIPSGLPEPVFFLAFKDVIMSGKYSSLYSTLLFMSLNIAVIISLRTLISIVSVDHLAGVRTDSNRELIGQGIGHMLTSFFGGIASSGSLSRTTASYQSGGRTRFSKLAAVAFSLLIILYGYRVVAYIPNVVLSGMLVVLGLSLFDGGTLRQFSLLFRKTSINRRKMIVNLLIISAVAAIMIVFGIFEAVGTGVFISIIMFVIVMGKKIIHRQYSGVEVRSYVQRPGRDIVILEKYGHMVRVLELEGSLFFGTAEQLSEVVDNYFSISHVEYIILDFRRIQTVDTTGLNILIQLKSHCSRLNKNLLISSINRNVLSYTFNLFKDQHFDSIDDAMAYAEDRLIEKYGEHENSGVELELKQIDAFHKFSDYETGVFAEFTDKVEFKAGQIIFRQGDKSDTVFFIAKGRALIQINNCNGGQKIKLSVLCAGTVFGEMALIDGNPRSAEAVALDGLVCYVLEAGQLGRLSAAYPDIAYKIITGIGHDMAKRIRIVNSMLTALRG